MILQDPGVIEGAFHHGLRTRLAVALQKLPLERAGVDADAHGAAVVPGRLNDLANPGGRADVAWIDAQTGGAGLGRLDAALVVEMNVGDQRHPRGLGDGREGGGGVLVGAGHPHDIGARLLQLTDLIDGRRRVAGDGVGHRLNGDRRIAADRNGSHVDLPRLAPIDRSPGAHMGVVLCGHDGGNIG